MVDEGDIYKGVKMEILLWDNRVKAGEPGFEIPLGETTSTSLSRDEGQHIVDIKTDLAYHLSIKLNKADMDQLRNRLTEIDAKKQAAKKHK